jgi:hypothetical protein
MTNRPNMRPDTVKEESPRDRAARRTAELRGHDTDLGDDGNDDFFIELGIIPDGWSYEWKTRTVLGAEDPAHQVALARRGWESVPASRHPELMPMGYKGVEITRKGMVLMERPMEITQEAKDATLRRARMQMRDKEAQLQQAKGGEFDRTNKGDPLVKISKKYEAIPIPE